MTLNCKYTKSVLALVDILAFVLSLLGTLAFGFRTLIGSDILQPWTFITFAVTSALMTLLTLTMFVLKCRGFNFPNLYVGSYYAGGAFLILVLSLGAYFRAECGILLVKGRKRVLMPCKHFGRVELTLSLMTVGLYIHGAVLCLVDVFNGVVYNYRLSLRMSVVGEGQGEESQGEVSRGEGRQGEEQVGGVPPSQSI